MVWSKNESRVGCRRMTDRKKVINGLSQCYMSASDDGHETQCADCPYFDPDTTVEECMTELRKDAIELLNASDLEELE